MSSRTWSRKRGISPFGVALTLVGVFLVVRSISAVETVLTPAPDRDPTRVSSGEPLLAQAQSRDALLKDSVLESRDPFVVQVTGPPPARPTPPPAAPVEPPVLRLIHFDEVSPEVLLEVNGQLSGRLTVGQVFMGWAVVSISPRVVEVYKDGKTYRLSPRR